MNSFQYHLHIQAQVTLLQTSLLNVSRQLSFLQCVLQAVYLSLLDLIILIILGEEPKLWDPTGYDSWNSIYKFNWRETFSNAQVSCPALDITRECQGFCDMQTIISHDHERWMYLLISSNSYAFLWYGRSPCINQIEAIMLSNTTQDL
jgi:hypothetical protein